MHGNVYSQFVLVSDLSNAYYTLSVFLSVSLYLCISASLSVSVSVSLLEFSSVYFQSALPGSKFALKCFSKLLNCFCLSPVDEQENENMKIDIIALTQTIYCYGYGYADFISFSATFFALSFSFSNRSIRCTGQRE